MAVEKASKRFIDDATVGGSYVLDLYAQSAIAGAVAPDYPYLVLTGSAPKRWADRMHHLRTNLMMTAGLDLVKGYPEGEEKDRLTAWLLGYIAHVVVDVVVHPIVNLIVGPYEANKTAHRLCEMTQDSYIFKEVKGLELTNAEYIDFLDDAASPSDGSTLHPVIYGAWDAMLSTAHADYYSSNPPQINSWYGAYKTILDTVDEAAMFSRHVRDLASDRAIFYRSSNEIPQNDRARFIDELPVPGGGTQNYMTLFEKSVSKVSEAWTKVFSDLSGGTSHAADYLKDWSLDTGYILGEDESGLPYFWA